MIQARRLNSHLIMDRLSRKTLDTIRKYDMISPAERIVVGVSGGPDSLALLYLLYDLRGELECSLHVAHLDHGLRGAESKADALYVEEHARKLDLPITVEAVHVSKMIMPKESLESGARRVRYEFYNRVMESTNAHKIALGHNADDQAETVIMRLLRGSGAQGLAGIPPVRDSKFIRPLIETTRSEIDEYLRQSQLTPRQDSSNLSKAYRRNRIRLELLPMLEQEYSPGIKQILRQTGDVLRDENDLLASLAEEAMGDCAKCLSARAVVIDIPGFRSYHVALQRRICRLAVKRLTGDLKGFDYDHIKALLQLALHGTTGSSISLPQGLSAAKTYDRLIIQLGALQGMDTEPFDYPVQIPGKTRIPELAIVIETTGPKKVHDTKLQSGRNGFQETFDFDKIQGNLHLRNRRPGDRFQPLGMSGTKKLKDFFIDEKIPKTLRDNIPILTDSRDILWIVGHRIDDRFKITPDTKTQITVTAIISRSAD